MAEAFVVGVGLGVLTYPYYQGLVPPPPGANFSQKWAHRDRISSSIRSPHTSASAAAGRSGPILPPEEGASGLLTRENAVDRLFTVFLRCGLMAAPSL